jgi:hypothetical protein
MEAERLADMSYTTHKQTSDKQSNYLKCRCKFNWCPIKHIDGDNVMLNFHSENRRHPQDVLLIGGLSGHNYM